jgi:hypothetical protein
MIRSMRQLRANVQLRQGFRLASPHQVSHRLSELIVHEGVEVALVVLPVEPLAGAMDAPASKGLRRARPSRNARLSVWPRDRLRGWGGRTRTAESVGIKIRRHCRGNFCRFDRIGAAEAVRVRAAALPTCSCGTDFAGIVEAQGWNSMAAGCSICLAGRIRTLVAAKKIILRRAPLCARLVA